MYSKTKKDMKKYIGYIVVICVVVIAINSCKTNDPNIVTLKTLDPTGPNMVFNKSRQRMPNLKIE